MTSNDWFASLGAIGTAALVIVFLFSASGKVVAWQASATWFDELSARVSGPVLLGLVVGSEVVLVTGLLAVPAVGTAAAAVWLLIASSILYAKRDDVVGCACFGGDATAVDYRSFVRNAFLIALAVAASIAQSVTPAVISGAATFALAAVAAGGLLAVQQLNLGRLRVPA